jgi:hypothetical protein
VHSRENDGVLTHAQIVIAAPHCDRLFATILFAPKRVRVMSLFALDIDEGPIPAFFVEFTKCSVEVGVVVQMSILHVRQRECANGRFVGPYSLRVVLTIRYLLTRQR